MNNDGLDESSPIVYIKVTRREGRNDRTKTALVQHTPLKLNASEIQLSYGTEYRKQIVVIRMPQLCSWQNVEQALFVHQEFCGLHQRFGVISHEMIFLTKGGKELSSYFIIHQIRDDLEMKRTIREGVEDILVADNGQLG